MHGRGKGELGAEGICCSSLGHSPRRTRRRSDEDKSLKLPIDSPCFAFSDRNSAWGWYQVAESLY